VEFGEIYVGTLPTRRAVLQNVGDDTLVISQVKTSCGCTAAMASSTRIAPNDTASLNITFNSKGFMGGVERGVEVISNDPLAPTMTIMFTASVSTLVGVDLPWFDFGTVKVDSQVTRTAHLKNLSKAPLHLLKVTSPDSMIVVHLEKMTLMPDEETELIARLVSSQPRHVNTDLVIDTDNKDQPKVYVRTMGVVVAK